MSRAVRLGLAGCGDIVRRAHLPNLLSIPGVTVTALADTDAARLASCAALAPEAARHRDAEAMIRDADVDAVLIALPNAGHAEAACQAFARGRHVYVEKPLATSLADGRRVIGAWRASGRVGMVGFGYRFHPLYVKARGLIGAGRLGRLVAARSVYASAQHDMPAWKASRATGGGVLQDLVSHEADLLSFVLGSEIVEVTARTTSGACDDDSAVVQVAFAQGSLGQVFASLWSVEDAGLEVYGDAGMLRLSRYGSGRVRLSGVAARGVLGSAWDGCRELLEIRFLLDKLRSPMNQPAFAAAMRRFVAAARGEAAASPDLMDGWRSLAVVMAAEESARTGRAAVPSALEENAA